MDVVLPGTLLAETGMEQTSMMGQAKMGRKLRQTSPRVTPVRMLLFLLLQCGGQGKVFTPVPKKDLLHLPPYLPLSRDGP